MGDLSNFTDAPKDAKVLSIDPYALVEAILGQRVDKPTPGGGSLADYEDLGSRLDQDSNNMEGQPIKPDSPPKDICVGAANPFALVEALLGRSIDKSCPSSAKLISSVLQTDYEELFDMKYDSVLFTGLRLNNSDRKAEMVPEKDMRVLQQKDMVTPNLSSVERVGDVEKIGVKDLEKLQVKTARMQNGKLHLVVNTHSLGKTLSNREVTQPVCELVSPFRKLGEGQREGQREGRWQPPNSSWRDMYDNFFERVNRRLIGDLSMFQIRSGDASKPTMHRFDDPVQGCATNSWLISALFSVFWADPAVINRATKVHSEERDEQSKKQRRLAVRLHDKGGRNNSRTSTIEVGYEIPINNSNNEPLYCRSSDGADIWPSLYEKAFAQWISQGSSQEQDQPDITQTHCGDPIKAMAQLNNREPHYFQVERHSASDIVGLVRANSMSFKTINPMCAWTYATGSMYRGCNVVANHAYSVLGYAVVGREQYIVLRNPWGVTEPVGLTSYPGLLERVEPSIWPPAALVDHGGLIAVEMQAFKHCFDYIGVAK